MFISLHSVTIPNFVKRICEYAFAVNPLTHITIPISLEYIDNGAFEDTGITPEMIPKSVKLGENVFT